MSLDTCTAFSCRCPMCGVIFMKISAQHLKHKHQMTRQEFKSKYPEYASYLDSVQIINTKGGKK